MKRYLWVIVLAFLCYGGGEARGDQKRELVFSALEPMTAQSARAQAADWLRSIGKTDVRTMERFEAIWSQSDRMVLDLVRETLAIGDERAAKLLSDARNTN